MMKSLFQHIRNDQSSHFVRTYTLLLHCFAALIRTWRFPLITNNMDKTPKSEIASMIPITSVSLRCVFIHIRIFLQMIWKLFAKEQGWWLKPSNKPLTMLMITAIAARKQIDQHILTRCHSTILCPIQSTSSSWFHVYQGTRISSYLSYDWQSNVSISHVLDDVLKSYRRSWNDNDKLVWHLWTSQIHIRRSRVSKWSDSFLLRRARCGLRTPPACRHNKLGSVESNNSYILLLVQPLVEDENHYQQARGLYKSDYKILSKETFLKNITYGTMLDITTSILKHNVAT